MLLSGQQASLTAFSIFIHLLEQKTGCRNWKLPEASGLELPEIACFSFKVEK